VGRVRVGRRGGNPVIKQLFAEAAKACKGRPLHEYRACVGRYIRAHYHK